MEALVQQGIALLQLLIEAIAGLIIGFAAVQAGARALFRFLRPAGMMPAEIRLQLGRWLSLGLEFQLASDVLGTTIAPSWDDIGKLAAIIVLRTALNYFLERDMTIRHD